LFECFCTENYTVALKKCEDATFTSDLSSAESECERKRRRERCRVVLSDHNVMSDENARINKQSNNVGNKVASGSIFAEKPRVPLSLLMRCKGEFFKQLIKLIMHLIPYLLCNQYTIELI
jgi:hypothetical protein